MDTPVHKEYITVMMLGSGLAAVHIGTFDDGDGAYQDIIHTGMGRYTAKDRHIAVAEAKAWAEAEELPYI